MQFVAEQTGQNSGGKSRGRVGIGLECGHREMAGHYAAGSGGDCCAKWN